MGQFQITEYAGGLLLVAVLIGVFYNLWRTTRSYGGIVGLGIRRIGVGITFLAAEAIDRVTENFSTKSFITELFGSDYGPLAHDAVFLLGLFFITLGFVKFQSALKS